MGLTIDQQRGNSSMATAASEVGIFFPDVVIYATLQDKSVQGTCTRCTASNVVTDNYVETKVINDSYYLHFVKHFVKLD